MSIAVVVEIEGGDEGRQMLSDINKYLPSIANNRLRKQVNNVKRDLQRNMRMAFTAPRGRLEESVDSQKIGFLKYNITMLDYGKYVDRGTRPHKVSKPYLFKPWQRRTGTRSLSSAIYNKGTKAHPFIEITKTRDVPRRIERFGIEFLSDLKSKMKGGK